MLHSCIKTAMTQVCVCAIQWKFKRYISIVLLSNFFWPCYLWLLHLFPLLKLTFKILILTLTLLKLQNKYTVLYKKCFPPYRFLLFFVFCFFVTLWCFRLWNIFLYLMDENNMSKCPLQKLLIESKIQDCIKAVAWAVLSPCPSSFFPSNQDSIRLACFRQTNPNGEIVSHS